MSKGLGTTQRKILLLLQVGISLGLSASPRHHFRVMKEFKKEWGIINGQQLERAIRSLYENKLLDEREEVDGTVTIKINKRGKASVMRYDPESIPIKKPKKWDGRWRLIMFDIPERLKSVRDDLRECLRNMGAVEMQKSVFVHPYPCEEQVDFLIEYFSLRRYVRYMEIVNIDIDLHLRKVFKIDNFN